jgi:hypothetical protein
MKAGPTGCVLFALASRYVSPIEVSINYCSVSEFNRFHSYAQEHASPDLNWDSKVMWTQQDPRVFRSVHTDAHSGSIKLKYINNVNIPQFDQSSRRKMLRASNCLESRACSSCNPPPTHLAIMAEYYVIFETTNQQLVLLP